MSIDREFLEGFVEEALDLMMGWERACLDLSKSDQTDQTAQLGELFRIAHNLKGGSKAVGLLSFGEFVHKVEDYIVLLKSNKISLNENCISLLLKCQSTLNSWLKAMKENPECTVETKTLLVEIQSIQNNPNDQVVEAKVVADQTDKPPEVTHESTTNGPTVSTNPKPQKKTTESVRVAVNKLEDLMQMIGELSIHQSIIAHGRQTGNLESKTTLNSIYLSGKITKSIQTQAMSLRMQPLEGLFQRLERTATDVAKSLNKKIEIVLEGSDVELDKTMTEKIADPLMHMVRNAVDHGVESADVRKEKNKADTAKILIAAIPDPTGVTIKVCDDGKGLDKHRILKKAVEKNMAKENSSPSDDEIYGFLFLPGFSTAEKVTDISGRGVGLDVVKTTLEKVGGVIKIVSQVDHGTEFILSLPTSLSVIDALVICVDGVRYAAPLPNLEEVIDVSQFHIERSSKENQMISLRDDTLPLEYLQEYLPLSQSLKKVEDIDSKRPALVVRSGSERVAFVVDGVVGQQQVVVRKLKEGLRKVPCFLGGTILGDGEPGFIIDLPYISRSFVQSLKRGNVC